MKQIKLLIFIAILSSCANLDKPYIKEEYKKFVNQYEKDFQTKILTNIKTAKHPKFDQKGSCNIENNTIYINNDLKSKTKIRITIYHELTHCHFKITKHDNQLITKNNEQIKKSIMHKKLVKNKTFKKYEKYYLNDLSEKISNR